MMIEMQNLAIFLKHSRSHIKKHSSMKYELSYNINGSNQEIDYQTRKITQ